MKIKRFIPLFLIIAAMAAAYLLGIGDYLSFDQLRTHRAYLQGAVANNPVIAPLVYMMVYAISTALSIPGGIYLTIFGGFLFGQPWGTAYAVMGATTGAVAIFLAAKTALGGLLKAKAEGRIAKMREGFQEGAISYLLFLRLVPLFPFWLVNIAPAFFGINLWTYVWTTFIGIIPGAFVFAQAGTGLGAILDSGEAFSVGTILNTQMKIALFALGCFALMPAVIKKIRG